MRVAVDLPTSGLKAEFPDFAQETLSLAMALLASAIAASAILILIDAGLSR